MSQLEIPGALTMLVPDGEGWEITSQGGTFEITKPGDDGAMHISVYERDGSPLGDGEAADVLNRLVSSAAGPGAEHSARVLKEDRGQHRAVTTFTATNNQGINFSWLGFVILWRERFLVCSCTAALDSAMPAEAEQMFATIFPPKRGLFRRR